MASGPARPAPWAPTSLNLGAQAASPAEGACSPSTRAPPPSKTVRPKVRTPPAPRSQPLCSGTVSLAPLTSCRGKRPRSGEGPGAHKQGTLATSSGLHKGRGQQGANPRPPKSLRRAGQAGAAAPVWSSGPPASRPSRHWALRCAGRRLGGEEVQEAEGQWDEVRGQRSEVFSAATVTSQHSTPTPGLALPALPTR